MLMYHGHLYISPQNYEITTNSYLNLYAYAKTIHSTFVCLGIVESGCNILQQTRI